MGCRLTAWRVSDVRAWLKEQGGQDAAQATHGG
jgi:predicted DNA-binding transcriptional regulator AlpA